MLVVIALGGNAFPGVGEHTTAESRRASIRMAAQALAPVAAEHQIIIGYGHGPEGALLALEGTRSDNAWPESMSGYMLEQELGNLLPFERPFATLLTMVASSTCVVQCHASERRWIRSSSAGWTEEWRILWW